MEENNTEEGAALGAPDPVEERPQEARLEEPEEEEEEELQGLSHQRSH